MDFLLNDLSLHGQFHAIPSFHEALDRLMQIRAIARKYDIPFHCSRLFASLSPSPNFSLPEAIHQLPRDKSRAIMSWLNQHGPFWDIEHDENDWYEYDGQIVSGSALAEAAHRQDAGVPHGLVSITPSVFQLDPISVERVTDQGRSVRALRNLFTVSGFADFAKDAPRLCTSWAQLKTSATTQFSQLSFTDTAFEPLWGHPYFPSAAQRILVILGILDQIKQCFSSDGSRTAEGHRIYQDFFTGKKDGGGRGAMFSDSSDGEKSEFATELHFPHPLHSGQSLFCPWHGKIQTPQFRVHFSYPIRHDSPLFVVYIGPKLTKR